MSEIKVSQMQEATNVNNEDYLMVVQNGVNKKARIENVRNNISVVDNLESESTTDGLSAKQGKALNEKITGTVLYENANGDNGSNFTLNDTIANYKEVKVDYVVSMGDYIINESKRVSIKDGQCVSLTCFMAHSDALQLLNIGRYLFSGASFTRVHETRARITAGNAVGWDGASTGTYITKITGYNI